MSTLYIRVRTGFYSHRKTAHLRLLIGDAAFWLPPRMWAYCAENQPDGDLSGYSADLLASLLAYPSNAQAMLQALKDSGFVDNDGFVHDWEEHNGFHRAFAKRAKAAADARWAKREPSICTKKGEKDMDMETSIAKPMLEASGELPGMPKKNGYHPDSIAVLESLNKTVGIQYRPVDSNLKLISARLKEPGVTLDGIRQMIVRQCQLWKGTDYGRYLRPETLFGQSKFDGYYAARGEPAIRAGSQNHRNDGLVGGVDPGKAERVLARREAERAAREAAKAPLAGQMARP